MLYQLSYPVGWAEGAIHGLVSDKRYRRCRGGSNMADKMGMSQVDRLFSQADATSPAKVLVVAEIGVNHDGEVGRGLDLIQAAAEAGADAVKLQLFRPDRLLSEQAVLAAYQRNNAGKQADEQAGGGRGAKALLAGLTLELDELGRLKEAADEAGLAFIVTPFSLGDVDDLATIGVDAVKIASPDAVNTPLIKAAAGLGRPMLISTGTCELDELAPAAEILKGHPSGGCLLHCVSSYPTPFGDAALGGIQAMHERFGLPNGYSDHTPDTLTGALAVAAGAVVLEKHLTYDTQADGPDHAASLSPTGFDNYVWQVRQAQTMLGPRCKTVQAIEQDVRKVSRQSVCAARDLPAGHRLKPGDLTVKRPGTGIPASKLESLVGQRLIRPVRANHLLVQDDIEAVSSASSARMAG